MTAVWEVTMGCNMRCGHCGSSCEEPLPGELTTQEALSLADQIADLGLRWITLSGGEPLTRADLPLIIEKFVSRSVAVNIISNGWFIDVDMAQTLKKSGVSTVAISVDGTRKVHDSIRMSGSFQRIKEAFSHLKRAKVTVGAITTISRKNMSILPRLRRELINMGVDLWQVQLGQPMGNFKERPDWVLSPEQVPDIIDFCSETAVAGEIKIFPADCIGYYTEKEIITRQHSGVGSSTAIWNGCNAGTRNFGILHNGDILGCTSIREKSFIEGNVKEQPLSQIWSKPDGFAWYRNMSKAQLQGDCAICIYGGRCLGGCSNTRLTMGGDIYSENLYCAYNVSLKSLRERLLQETDVQWLIAQAEHCLANQEFQTAAFFVDRALTLCPDEKKALAIKGFAEFMCGNYALCETANRTALELDPNDTYAMKGLGLALHKQGDSAQGLEHLEKAAKMTNYADADVMHDLEFVRREMSQKLPK